jgi:hypothetical protein
MRIEDNIQKFANFLGEIVSKLNISQRGYAKKLLEEILTEMSYIQRKNEVMALELSGLKGEDYPDLLLKSVALLQLVGFDKFEIAFYTRNEIDFLLNNMESIKNNGKCDYDRISNILKLVKYHEQTTGIFPEKISDLKESYKEIKCNKTE